MLNVSMRLPVYGLPVWLCNSGFPEVLICRISADASYPNGTVVTAYAYDPLDIYSKGASNVASVHSLTSVVLSGQWFGQLLYQLPLPYFLSTGTARLRSVSISLQGAPSTRPHCKYSDWRSSPLLYMVRSCGVSPLYTLELFMFSTAKFDMRMRWSPAS